MTHSKGSGPAAINFDRQPGRLFPPPRGKVAGGRMGGLGSARSRRSSQLSPPPALARHLPRKGGGASGPAATNFDRQPGRLFPPPRGKVAGGRMGGLGSARSQRSSLLSPPPALARHLPREGGGASGPAAINFDRQPGRLFPPSRGKVAGGRMGGLGFARSQRSF